jgi:hypothetical protein
VNDQEIEKTIQGSTKELLELAEDTLKIPYNNVGSFRALLELVIRFNSVRAAVTLYLEQDMTADTREACEQINAACTKAIIHIMGYDAIMAQINPSVKRTPDTRVLN